MAIVQNTACPSCTATGHDKSGDHLIVFADGAKFCNRAHFHKSGKTLYIAPNGKDPIMDEVINGKLKYTVEQFKELLTSGKLDNPAVRAIALTGMRNKDAWEVMNEHEKAVLKADWEHDMAFFETLSFKNLVCRGIKGPIAKFYNARVGLDAQGKVDRHYYPRYSKVGELIGAKCRTLPKDFKFGTLGRMWGEGMLFGQNTMSAVMATGRRKDILILTGGEPDAMATQQMLMEAQDGSKYAGQWYHVWSTMKGEAVKEIVDNKEEIAKFKKIILAFDNDEVGQKLTRDVARMFRDKTVMLQMPSGCKDPNQCLIEGRAKEFVDAFWNPVEVFTGGTLKRVSALVSKALVTPTMGQDWPWPTMNPLTFGIRPHALYIIGAGTGVGKTETTKEICFHLMEKYQETVGVIYLEEQPAKTVRSYAGKLINRRIEEPPINDPAADGYSEEYDYQVDEAEEAILKLEAQDLLVVADTGGNKDLDTVMSILDEMLALGITKIVLDNLTAIELPKGGSKVEAIDEAMKRIGTFKDEKPVSIFLLSHLNRPKDPRKPHEMGGEVHITDFRGSGSISFWANVIVGIERNTYGATDEEKRLTTYRIVKCRDRGVSVGRTVQATMSPSTGRLLEVRNHGAYRAPTKPTQPKEPAVKAEPDAGAEF